MVAVLSVLAGLGVQIGPLIAGAGIFGVAIGFGSQTLVKDVLSGVFYMLDDPVSALADLHQAVELEPRHFGAWTALGHLFMASDEKAQALAAYRKVLQIRPQTSDIQTIVSHLGPEIEGQDL